MGCSDLLKRLLSVLMLGAVLPAAAVPSFVPASRGVGWGAERAVSAPRACWCTWCRRTAFLRRMLKACLGPSRGRPRPKAIADGSATPGVGGTVADAQGRVQRLRVDPSGVGVTLFRAPVADGVVWESSYQCMPQSLAWIPELGWWFRCPPAITLLLAEPTALDLTLQGRLEALADQCDGSISKAQLIQEFNLAALDLRSWPERLPVRCLF